MSYFEGRRELGEAAHKAIERASGNLRKLATALQHPDATAADRQQLLASLLEASGFQVDWDTGGVQQAFTAHKHRWNSEDMRKGLRHGHVAFAAATSAPDVPDGIDWDPLDVVAAVASAIGLSATLKNMYGAVSLIAVPAVTDIPKLVEAGIFESPDCLFIMRADASGHGHQHTINTGDHLARLELDVSIAEGSEQFVRELHAAVESIIDEIEDPDGIEPTATGFVIKARTTATINGVADRIMALARARAASSGIDVTVEKSDLITEFQLSRILARRIKTFCDTYKFAQDRVVKEPAHEPTRWGAISQIAATAKVRFPVSSEDAAREIGDADVEAAKSIAKATAGAGLDVLGDMEFRGFVEGEMIRGLRERGITRTPRRWLGVHPVIPSTNDRPQQTRTYPDVIVRGPGLPDPTRREEPNDDES